MHCHSLSQREERIITIEDSAELQLIDKPNLVRLETRNANTEGVLPITIRDPIKTALRMRPNRVIVGECRGAEALDVLAGDEYRARWKFVHRTCQFLQRYVEPIGNDGFNGDGTAASGNRSQIASGIDFLIHLGRMRDKSRKVLSITEIAGYEENQIILNDIYRFKEKSGRKRKKIQCMEQWKRSVN